MASASGNGQLDVGSVESGLTALLAAYERSVEEAGAVIPQAQLRALLVIEQAGSLNLSQLAAALAASASATSRLCERMQLADLLTRDRAAASRREIVLLPTEAGRRLAGWVRGRRRAALEEVLRQMSPAGRAALARGLAELGAGAGDSG